MTLRDALAVCLLAAPATAAPSATVPLFSDLGRHHHPVTTRSAEAQRYFDQGLRLIYGFNHDEARRAFQQAARLDPSCAMAWWGVALSLGPNINAPIDPDQNKSALEAIASARAAGAVVTQAERDYIDALSTRYAADPGADRAALDRAYADAMKTLTRAYPDDLDAATLYAESLMDVKPWKLWTADGAPAEGTEEIVATLESVLRRDPMHPGANHYYIHAVEASPHPERALPSARRLETLVPGAGHLVHMPSHIYMRTGAYDEAARSNASAAEVDRRYLARTGAGGMYPIMYYSHNLHFLVAARCMEGRRAEAVEAARRLADHIAPSVETMPMAEFMLPWPWYVSLRFQQWDAILAAREPAAGLATSRALWRFARGVAFAAKGDSGKAATERDAFRALVSSVPDGLTFGLNPARSVLKVADAVLEARLAAAQGLTADAEDAWRRAVAAQDALSYDEPADWYYPVRESLGAALLAARRSEEAETIFRADLDRNPRNGRSLFGLMKCLEARGRKEDAAWVRGQYEEAWKGSDVTLKLEDF